MRMIGRWGDRQHPADRLDPIRPAVIVDEGDHGLNRRSSSAWAKYAEALRRISLAWRSSRFSRSSALSLSAISVVRPGLRPLSRRPSSPTHCSVCDVQPILRRYRDDRCPSRRMLALVIHHHPHRTRTDLRRKLVRCLARHGSTFSRVGASDKPGAVQEFGFASDFATSRACSMKNCTNGAESSE